MRKYNVNQEFNVVVSTKATLYGALAGDFEVYYAPTNNLTNRTSVAGGLTEAVETIDTPNTATLAASAAYGSQLLIAQSGHTIEAGDVIEYATGKMAYVAKVVGEKIYLRTKLQTGVASGATITQVGNTGLYNTVDFSIPSIGEYLVTIEAPEYGIMVESRVGIVEESEATPIDGDAPIYSEIAVAY
jgi:hypothetical protein